MADSQQRVPSEPPPAVSSQRVLHYALLDKDVGYNSGHGLILVDGRELGKVPCLVICQEAKTSKFLVYYCDIDWEASGCSAHDSIAAAKTRAESIFPGSSAKWVEAHFTEEEVTRYLDEIWIDCRCSFCGKRPDQGVEAIFKGSGNARICDKCVAEFSRR
ncbi:MAG TPA: ClpX C4-type zinc finger protein [Candidatus Acidoferrales bacterium]|nr:ClpX C4-type zinc finger protein [Candidatus Acidoferrales bacterium]